MRLAMVKKGVEEKRRCWWLALVLILPLLLLPRPCFVVVGLVVVLLQSAADTVLLQFDLVICLQGARALIPPSSSPANTKRDVRVCLH